MISESEVLTACLKHLGNRPGVRVWRNQTGALPDRAGRVIRFGLTGSADIIGIRQLEFFAHGAETFDILDGVGESRRVGVRQCRRTFVGQFIAVECKSATGRVSTAQDAFARMVRSLGGLYILARDVSDLYSEFPPLK